MNTINFFKEKDKAYILNIKNYNKIDTWHIEETIVQKIGRKYVTTEWNRKWQESDAKIIGCHGLVCFEQPYGCNYKYLLFPTKQDAEIYIEMEQLYQWARNFDFDTVSIETLRQIKELCTKNSPVVEERNIG